MKAALLHLFAFAVTMGIGAFALGVITMMARQYWQKALFALRGPRRETGMTVTITSAQAPHPEQERKAA